MQFREAKERLRLLAGGKGFAISFEESHCPPSSIGAYPGCRPYTECSLHIEAMKEWFRGSTFQEAFQKLEAEMFGTYEEKRTEEKEEEQEIEEFGAPGEERMTFKDAREKLKRLAGENCYLIAYEELYIPSGKIFPECNVLIKGMRKLFSALTFQRVFNNLEDELNRKRGKGGLK